jgi:hypothetical protein
MGIEQNVHWIFNDFNEACEVRIVSHVSSLVT